MAFIKMVLVVVTIGLVLKPCASVQIQPIPTTTEPVSYTKDDGYAKTTEANLHQLRVTPVITSGTTSPIPGEENDSTSTASSVPGWWLGKQNNTMTRPGRPRPKPKPHTNTTMTITQSSGKSSLGTTKNPRIRPAQVTFPQLRVPVNGTNKENKKKSGNFVQPRTTVTGNKPSTHKQHQPKRNTWSTSRIMEASSLEDLKDRFADLVKAATQRKALFMKNLKARYPPVYKLFDGVARIRDKLSNTKKVVLEKMLGNVDEGPAEYDLTQMSNPDVLRMLDDLEELPDTVRERLISNLTNCTMDEIEKLPSNIIPSFGQSKFEELRNLGVEKLDVLCDKLLDDGSSPWNLVSALRGGLRCDPMPDLTNKKKCKLTLSQVMMDLVRVESPPSSWDISFFKKVLQSVWTGVTEEDIQSIPYHLVRDNVKTIVHSDLPFESQRAAMMRKMVSSYTTPTAWPDQLIRDMGKLLEDVRYQNLMLVRYNVFEGSALELSKAGITKNITRVTLSKAMMKVHKVSPSPEILARVLPWLKGEVNFIQNLNITNLIEAMEKHNLSMESLTRSEIYQLTKRVEALKRLNDLVEANQTDEVRRYMDPYLVSSFSSSLLESLPDDLIFDIQNRTKTMHSKRKARFIINRIKRALQTEGRILQPVDIGGLFNGIALSDVSQFEQINDKEMEGVVPFLQSLNVPEHIAWAVTKKAIVPAKRTMLQNTPKNEGFCDDFLPKLGRLAKYVDLGFIKEHKLIPLGSDGKGCGIDIENLQLTRAQAYAMVDNIRETMGTKDETGKHALKPDHIKRLGRLGIGLAAEDIEMLPTDTELLTVIEMLAKYEDELDSSQIKAIVGKIRDYFDIRNRNVIDEATDIIVAQIGRFLQYLNVDFELPKFPKGVRPTIMREIGKSSLSKLSTPHRQKLLRFALKNIRVGHGEIDDVTRSYITETHLIDLGRLKCGLTPDLVDKMTSSAFDAHLEDIHECPFKDDVAEAVLQKALNYNTNRLKLREHLASMAGLLQYLSDKEMDEIDTKELVPIMEYIVRASRSRDMAWKAVEKSGFVRERSTSDKQKNKERKRRLFEKLIYANKVYYGIDDICQTILKLGEDAGELGLFSEPCIEDTATLPNWGHKEARTALEEITEARFALRLSNETAGSLSEDFIQETVGLLKGLTAQEMANLNVTSDTVFYVGIVNGLSPEQLRSILNKVIPSSKENLKTEDFVNLQSVACGLTPSEIRSIKDSTEIRDAITTLGRIKDCGVQQVSAFAEKYVEAMGSAIPKWNISDIHSMGNIIGGLSRQQLTMLTRRQLQALEPSVISDMPPKKVAEFTVAQLKEFTPHQSHAITSMQRSYMNEEQMTAVTGAMNIIYDNGSSVNSMQPIVVLILVLAASFGCLGI